MAERFRTNWWRASVRSSDGYFVRLKAPHSLSYRDSAGEVALYVEYQYRGLRADVVDIGEREVPDRPDLTRAELLGRITRALKAAGWRVVIYPEDNGSPFTA